MATNDAHIGIVGAGLGGLSAAIHLRLAGHEVDVYEANDTPGGRANRISLDRFHFDTGPSLLNYPWVFRELFESAGRRMEDYVTLLPVDPGLVFRWPDGKQLALSGDASKLVESFERLEPGCAPSVFRFLRDTSAKFDLAFDKVVTRNCDGLPSWLSGMTPREMARMCVWRSLYGELGRFFHSRHIREALGCYGMYLGGSPFTLPGFFSILAFGEIGLGLWLPNGGVYGLVEAIAQLACDIGVGLHLNRAVERIETRAGAVQGLQFTDGSTASFRTVVSNVDVPTTDSRLLGREPRLRNRRRKNARTRMTPGVVTFYWAVKGRLEGIPHHTIFLPEGYREAFDDLTSNGAIPEQLPFYVSVPSETDPGLAPEGDSTVFVLAPTPVLSAMDGVDWDEAVRSIRGRVLKRLSDEGFTLPEERVLAEQVYTPGTWADRFGLHDGSAFGAAHTLFQVGPFRAANHIPELRGMYYAGAGTTPGTGMPMVVLSGKLAADRIIGHAC